MQRGARRLQAHLIIGEDAISSVGRKRAWGEALALLRGMVSLRQDGVDAGCYSAAAKACARGTRWPLAIQLLGEMKLADVELHISGYNSVLGALARQGLTAHTSLLLSEMWQSGPTPDVTSYQTLLGAYVHKGWWQRALAQLRDMSATELSPNALTYSGVLSACGSSRQWSRALPLLQEAQDHQVEPDAGLYSSVLCTLAQGKQWQPAQHILSEMQMMRLEPRSFACNALLNAYRARGWKPVLRLFDSLSAEGFSPDLFTIGSIVGACADDGRWLEALEMLVRARELGLRADALCFGAALRACSAEFRWQAALETLFEASLVEQVSPVGLHEALVACTSAQSARHLPGLCSDMRAFVGTEPRVLLSGRQQGEGEAVLVASTLRGFGLAGMSDIVVLERSMLRAFVRDLGALQSRGAIASTSGTSTAGYDPDLSRCGGLSSCIALDVAESLQFSSPSPLASARAYTWRHLMCTFPALPDSPAVGVLGVCADGMLEQGASRGATQARLPWALKMTRSWYSASRARAG
mmetsp:Transcript_138413/g.441548  ORF Transcript_138413/g.441548 Transcript_138413/m.441548 type:complete len:525 (+) Transcript_138413:58-1632(+)